MFENCLNPLQGRISQFNFVQDRNENEFNIVKKGDVINQYNFVTACSAFFMVVDILTSVHSEVSK